MKKVKSDITNMMNTYEIISDDDVFTIAQIASIYGVTQKAIKTIIDRNMNEFLDDGVVVASLEDYKNFVRQKGIAGNTRNEEYTFLIPNRSMKRIGCFLSGSGMGTFTRNYLLNIESVSTSEQKKDAIHREVGIIERKRMATAIAKYVPEGSHKKFAYPNYTNMIYKLLFNRTAKDMRNEKGLKTNDALRETFTTDQLKLVEEAETIVTALVTLGFEYRQIKEQLERKYTKLIA